MIYPSGGNMRTFILFSASLKEFFLNIANDSGTTEFLDIIVALLALTMILLFIVLLYAKKRNDRILGVRDLQTSLQILVTAKVVSKRDFRTDTDSPDPFSHIMFELESGQRLDFAFRTDDPRYYAILVGDTGTLTYAGRAFVDFKRVTAMY